MFEMSGNLQYTGNHERIEDIAARLNNDMDFVMTLERSGIDRMEVGSQGSVQHPYGSGASWILSRVVPVNSYE